MEQIEGIQIVGLAAAYIVVEFAKFVLTLKRNGASCLTPQEQNWLKGLHEQHSLKDVDGRPIWYMPKATFSNVAKQQEKTIEALDAIVVSQKDISNILERILERLK